MKEHQFAICAYKESKYLEQCIRSLMNQTEKSNIIMCTSTPNDYINLLAKKYNIVLKVREGKSDIKDDWNFAYNCCDAKYVTIVHQDDLYSKKYVENMMGAIKKYDEKKKYGEIIIGLSDYLPIKKGAIGDRDINSKIRRLLRVPLKCRFLAANKLVRRMILSLGNSIVCPSVIYNKEKLGDSIFTSEMKFNIDWDTFFELGKRKGLFMYVDKPLVFYRIHDDATSKEFIENNGREKEDMSMFCKFWPKPIAKFIMRFYKKAYKTYD